MALEFYDTLTKQKKPFEPIDGKTVRMYHCGPTVYNFVHIGNLRSFTFADLLRRTLEYFGYDVLQVMNITDVGHMQHDDEDSGEDKLEAAARENQKDPWQIAAEYTECFLEDIRSMNFEMAQHYPKATDHIPEMIALIERLLEKGFAYRVGANVYFDVQKFERYGALSGNTLDALESGARIAVNEEKHDPRDFALWKHDPKHIMKWDSPFGEGFPGWHIECSAMSMKYLGETFDIHTGGEDNIFPHHECEIAQSEGATGQPFVKLWMHARFLLVDGKKMSKSLGNFFTLRDLKEKGYSGQEVRFALLKGHYRQQLNFTLSELDGARTWLDRYNQLFASLREERPSGEVRGELKEILERSRQGFEAGLSDDLNISVALAAVSELIRDVNRLGVNAVEAKLALAWLERIDSVLGVATAPEAEASDPEIDALVAARQQARADKDWAEADRVRDELNRRGVVVVDTPQGPKWKWAD
ncbi:MAG: cysteine--tRNA ligase [Planctomycetota bacterium]